MDVVIGTAGWSIPSTVSSTFSETGTALERYSRILGGVEVNSSFYRSHRASTWAKWAASVPSHFRFSVKIPKAITHEAKLTDVEIRIKDFISEIAPLGDKLGALLVQLPPKLAFDRSTAELFFTALRTSCHADVVCEPRNATWFDDEADETLVRLRVARVAADPSLAPGAAVPGGWPGLSYWRLHGSPAMYRSSYSEERIETYATRIGEQLSKGRRCWCVFDNTAASAALGNALSLKASIEARGEGSVQTQRPLSIGAGDPWHNN